MTIEALTPTTQEEEHAETPRFSLRVEVPVENFEIRESDDGDDSVEFEGYGIKWGEEARINSFFFSFAEKFKRGAFKKTLKERGVQGNGQIKLKLRHRASEPNAGKFLTLKEDEVGLRIKARTIPTRTGRDLAVELREGTLDTFSIAFDSITERFDKDEQLREVLEAKLYEVSAVDWPAYAGAQVDAVRSQLRDGLPQFLDLLEAELREGRDLSDSSLSRLAEARDRIQAVLDSAGTSDEDEPEEEPPADRSEEGSEGDPSGPDDPPLEDREEDATPTDEEEGVFYIEAPEDDLDLELGLRERELQLATAVPLVHGENTEGSETA